jgi:bifunctional UDP-N-acetylglucosamine pyrophosphorylase/glucosamine-1-phosphate N-acetyltransferase
VSVPLVQAVVIAAGQGTRTRRGGAKALLPALGVPLLEHVLRAVKGVGADPTVVVVGHQAEAVEKAFAGRGLTFVLQEPRRGTGHAVQAAERVLGQGGDRTVLVVNGDLPLLRASTLAGMLERHREAGAAATLLSATLPDPAAYGRVVRDGRGRIKGIVEARDASPEELKGAEINVGVYAFAVPLLLGALQKLTPQNAQGELYLTDVIGHLAEDGQKVESVRTGEPLEALGVNTLAELAEASRRLQERRLDELMVAGVLVEDPATTTVGLDVVVEPEATLRPFTLLEGRTVVRAGARIGPFARLADTEVGPGAQILDHCLLRECVVEAGAAVGPFAHIRPESRIGPGARVGNFVEMKKADLGQGSKASHLSYLGDATIGPGVNIGAGTITCNYDGTAKHVTRIEAGAFVGSNTVLVAPVTVGEGAYVAAGSAITEDVPAQALALGRARQVNKPGWAAKRRRGGERP